MSAASARQTAAWGSSQQCRVSRKYRRSVFGNQLQSGCFHTLSVAKFFCGLQIWSSSVGFFREKEQFLCPDFTGLRD